MARARISNPSTDPISEFVSCLNGIVEEVFFSSSEGSLVVDAVASMSDVDVTVVQCQCVGLGRI